MMQILQRRVNALDACFLAVCRLLSVSAWALSRTDDVNNGDQLKMIENSRKNARKIMGIWQENFGKWWKAMGNGKKLWDMMEIFSK